MVVSLSSYFGGSTPARRELPFLAWSVTICTWRDSGNMSGARRVPSSTDGSIFLAAANFSALLRIADSALRPCSNTGMDACDIENDMTGFPRMGRLLAAHEMEQPMRTCKE